MLFLVDILDGVARYIEILEVVKKVAGKKELKRLEPSILKVFQQYMKT